MEVRVESYAENISNGEKILANRSFIIFVALDDSGKPTPVPELLLNTPEEEAERQRAKERRDIRLSRG